MSLELRRPHTVVINANGLIQIRFSICGSQSRIEDLCCLKSENKLTLRDEAMRAEVPRQVNGDKERRVSDHHLRQSRIQGKSTKTQQKDIS